MQWRKKKKRGARTKGGRDVGKRRRGEDLKEESVTWPSVACLLPQQPIDVFWLKRKSWEEVKRKGGRGSKDSPGRDE